MGMQWADGASATLVRQGETVRIGYRWPDGDGWRTAVQTVRLMAHRPHLGGTCFYLACPACGRRVLKLFDLAGPVHVLALQWAGEPQPE